VADLSKLSFFGKEGPRGDIQIGGPTNAKSVVAMYTILEMYEDAGLELLHFTDGA
jgi:hypothetical protein